MIPLSNMPLARPCTVFQLVSTEMPEVNIVFGTITTTVLDTTTVVEFTTTERTVAETLTSYESVLQTLTVYTATVTSRAPHSYVTTEPWNGGAVVKRSEIVPEQRLKRKRRRGCLKPTLTASSPFTASIGSSPHWVNFISSSFSASHTGTAPYWTNSTSSTYPAGTLSHWTTSAASSILCHSNIAVLDQLNLLDASHWHVHPVAHFGVQLFLNFYRSKYTILHEFNFYNLVFSH